MQKRLIGHKPNNIEITYQLNHFYPAEKCPALFWKRPAAALENCFFLTSVFILFEKFWEESTYNIYIHIYKCRSQHVDGMFVFASSKHCKSISNLLLPLSEEQKEHRRA